METTVRKGQAIPHDLNPQDFSCISRFLLGIDVPDNVVWKTVNAVASSFGHFSEAFGFRLVFEGVAGEVDA